MVDGTCAWLVAAILFLCLTSCLVGDVELCELLSSRPSPFLLSYRRHKTEESRHPVSTVERPRAIGKRSIKAWGAGY